MKIGVLTSRILLGILFLIFGLNDFLHFIPVPPMPPSDGLTFANIMLAHHYMTFVGGLMVIASVLLLIGRYIPIALVILGPILVNILLYHFLLDQSGAITGVIATLLEIFLIWAYRLSFRGGLFDFAPEVS